MARYPDRAKVIALLNVQAEKTARLLTEYLAEPEEFRNILWNEFSALLSQYEALPKVED